MNQLGSNGHVPQPHTIYPSPRRKRSSSSPTPTNDRIAVNGSPSTRRLTTSNAEDIPDNSRQDVPKLSSAKLQELTAAPDSLPIRAVEFGSHEKSKVNGMQDLQRTGEEQRVNSFVNGLGIQDLNLPQQEATLRSTGHTPSLNTVIESPPPSAAGFAQLKPRHTPVSGRPRLPSRAISTPTSRSTPDPRSEIRKHATEISADESEDFHSRVNGSTKHRNSRPLEPTLPTSPFLPAPPFSIPTYLQLELASERPSPLYIHRSSSYNAPYEATQVKYQRLLNFLLLPPQLEQTLFFGTLTCLDAWLYLFTILPLRFFKAFVILSEWMYKSITAEIQDLSSFIYNGLGRVWHRRRRRSSLPVESPHIQTEPYQVQEKPEKTPPSTKERIIIQSSKSKSGKSFHRRAKSITSMLQQNHKADFLQGLLVIFSSMILMKFDASRMYHNIRGQAAIKLYVIYNVLEVCDRLFSALGQDILECLFSPESLERNPDGRSKVKRPFWLFLLALIYTVIHATALFYQVITLNVAVNSYSNALLTLLMSNQFVEIKGTVFKRIEKENLFQLTCADVVERFQLWLMLLIIALRNIVEVGGLSISSATTFSTTSSSHTNPESPPNATATTATPHSSFSILPNAFTLLPSLLPFQVLSPFLLVLGSEMLVDWLKHAYINKFNAISPRIYSRYLDVLAKDYYSNAFAEQNLTRRLGLPVIPLACLFIRATLQTYHMFLATNISPPAISTSTSLTSNENTDPTSSPLLAKLDTIFRRALDQSSFGGGSRHPSSSSSPLWRWTIDDAIALTTMLLFFLALYLLLLAFKLLLGMFLLSSARARYRALKKRDADASTSSYTEPGSKRLGGWGVTEVGDERRRVIYGSEEGENRGRRESAKEREREPRKRKDDASKGDRLEKVERYDMVAKRIW